MRSYIKRMVDIFNRKGLEHKESGEYGMDEETDKDKEIELDILFGFMSFVVRDGFGYNTNRYIFLIWHLFLNTDYSLCVNMTENNELEFIHTYETTTRLRVDVSSLQGKHQFAFSWNVKDDHFAIYIDETLVMENRPK